MKETSLPRLLLLFTASLVGNFLLALVAIGILFQIEEWFLLPLFATSLIFVGQALSRRHYYKAGAILLGLVAGVGLGIWSLVGAYSI